MDNACQVHLRDGQSLRMKGVSGFENLVNQFTEGAPGKCT